MVVHACPHTTWEVEAEEAGGQEFEVILDRITYRV